MRNILYKYNHNTMIISKKNWLIIPCDQIFRQYSSFSDGFLNVFVFLNYFKMYGYHRSEERRIFHRCTFKIK